jgi:D-amino-acid dehydrogenase
VLAAVDSVAYILSLSQQRCCDGSPVSPGRELRTIIMARTDAIVLGAGIVGASIALHLAKRGLSVALIDRRGPGEETSYGNAGVIEGNTLFPHAFPSGLGKLLSIALKRAPEANYHLSFLPRVAPWLLAYRRQTQAEGSIAFAEAMRPLFARAVSEHEALMAEAGATRYLRKDGWLKLYRGDASFAATAPEREFADRLGLPHRAVSGEEARVLEPALSPVFRHAVHWPEAASVSNPLAVTKAYAAQFVIHGGVLLQGDARTLRRASESWRVDADEGPVDAKQVVVALGPWAPDLLDPLGIRLPLAYKRGYHRHFRPRGNAGLTRPVVDVEYGYCLAPMEQGIRLTTGAEFADRDAPPTPVQFDRLMPAAKGLFPLGEPVEAQPWMGSRPTFADSRPVIGRAPGQPGLWLAYGHAHWGLTLGPVTGRLLAEMMTGATPFCDPAPYSAERFSS